MKSMSSIPDSESDYISGTRR